MSAPVIVAHREERRLIGIDFTQDLLETGGTVSSVDEIKILDTDGGDITPQFRGATPPAPTLSGNKISFWKEIAASASDQLPGRYRVRCRVIVDNAEEPIALDVNGKLVYLRIVGD